MPVPPFGRARYEPINARDWVDRLALCTDGLFTSPIIAEPPNGTVFSLVIPFPVTCPFVVESSIPFPVPSLSDGSICFPVPCIVELDEIGFPLGSANLLREIDFPLGKALDI